MATVFSSHETTGRHILLDVWGVDFQTLNDLTRVRQWMVEAAQASGATIVDAAFHRFPEQGFSGVLVLAESHISVHTFPEHGYASFDIYTCGDTLDPSVACAYLVEKLGTTRYFTRHFVRGMAQGIEERTPTVAMGS
ncbi:MAG: adenosylmethionine decarboxylase [Clostridiales bacterium]|nr:adenosylmethionine decarboxylase [Clostridiales bacterium]